MAAWVLADRLSRFRAMMPAAMRRATDALPPEPRALLGIDCQRAAIQLFFSASPKFRAFTTEAAADGWISQATKSPLEVQTMSSAEAVADVVLGDERAAVGLDMARRCRAKAMVVLLELNMVWSDTGLHGVFRRVPTDQLFPSAPRDLQKRLDPVALLPQCPKGVESVSGKLATCISPTAARPLRVAPFAPPAFVAAGELPVHSWASGVAIGVEVKTAGWRGHDFIVTGDCTVQRTPVVMWLRDAGLDACTRWLCGDDADAWVGQVVCVSDPYRATAPWMLLRPGWGCAGDYLEGSCYIRVESFGDLTFTGRFPWVSAAVIESLRESLPVRSLAVRSDSEISRTLAAGLRAAEGVRESDGGHHAAVHMLASALRGSVLQPGRSRDSPTASLDARATCPTPASLRNACCSEAPGWRHAAAMSALAAGRHALKCRLGQEAAVGAAACLMLVELVVPPHKNADAADPDAHADKAAATDVARAAVSLYQEAVRMCGAPAAVDMSGPLPLGSGASASAVAQMLRLAKAGVGAMAASHGAASPAASWGSQLPFACLWEPTPDVACRHAETHCRPESSGAATNSSNTAVFAKSIHRFFLSAPASSVPVQLPLLLSRLARDCHATRQAPSATVSAASASALFFAASPAPAGTRLSASNAPVELRWAERDAIWAAATMGVRYRVATRGEDVTEFDLAVPASVAPDGRGAKTHATKFRCMDSAPLRVGDSSVSDPMVSSSPFVGAPSSTAKPAPGGSFRDCSPHAVSATRDVQLAYGVGDFDYFHGDITSDTVQYQFLHSALQFEVRDVPSPNSLERPQRRRRLVATRHITPGTVLFAASRLRPSVAEEANHHAAGVAAKDLVIAYDGAGSNPLIFRAGRDFVAASRGAGLPCGSNFCRLFAALDGERPPQLAALRPGGDLRGYPDPGTDAGREHDLPTTAGAPHNKTANSSFGPYGRFHPSNTCLAGHSVNGCLRKRGPSGCLMPCRNMLRTATPFLFNGDPMWRADPTHIAETVFRGRGNAPAALAPLIGAVANVTGRWGDLSSVPNVLYGLASDDPGAPVFVCAVRSIRAGEELRAVDNHDAALISRTTEEFALDPTLDEGTAAACEALQRIVRDIADATSPRAAVAVLEKEERENRLEQLMRAAGPLAAEMFCAEVVTALSPALPVLFTPNGLMDGGCWTKKLADESMVVMRCEAAGANAMLLRASGPTHQLLESVGDAGSSGALQRVRLATVKYGALMIRQPMLTPAAAMAAQALAERVVWDLAADVNYLRWVFSPAVSRGPPVCSVEEIEQVMAVNAIDAKINTRLANCVGQV